MAPIPYISGPQVISWGGVELGRTDGNEGITITEIVPHAEITSDEQGGQPVDYIQQGGRAVVSMLLNQWDDTVMDELIAAMDASSTQASPAFAARGNVGGVGMLRIADGGFKELKITPTKPRANGGAQIYTFPRAFREPSTDTSLEQILAGNAARRPITMICLPDDTAGATFGDYYTAVNVI